MLINFTNYPKLLIEATLTSFSTSLSKVVNIYIKLISVISFPKASANSGKFFANANLTFHDLSSVAAIITGNVWVLFSSLFKILANNFKLSKHKTLTES